MKELESIKKQFENELSVVKTNDDLNNLRTNFLGKNGHLTLVMKLIKDMSVEEKKAFGVGVNVLKDEVSKAIDNKKVELENLAIEEELKISLQLMEN